MPCKPTLNRRKEHKALEEKFQVTNLKPKGRLQFFFHCPDSSLPIRDVRHVKNRRKKEPHIEKNAENYCVKCYQNNIICFLKSREKYLFLFTQCASREPVLSKFHGERYIVGYIMKERWLPRGDHYAVQGPTKIVTFKDAFPLSKFAPSARYWRVKRFDEQQTSLILEHLSGAKNIHTKCIHEIRLLNRRYSKAGGSCR